MKRSDCFVLYISLTCFVFVIALLGISVILGLK